MKNKKKKKKKKKKKETYLLTDIPNSGHALNSVQNL